MKKNLENDQSIQKQFAQRQIYPDSRVKITTPHFLPNVKRTS